jgi:hypothetical protein
MQLNSKIALFFKRFGCSAKEQAAMQQQIDAKAVNVQNAEVILSAARKKLAEAELEEQCEMHLNRLQVQVEAFHPLQSRLDGHIARIFRHVDLVVPLVLLVICSTLSMGENTNTDLLTAQKTCYEQATLVESKPDSMSNTWYGTQWTNHYDAHTKTCWLLEVWFDTRPTDESRQFHMIRVFDAFVAHAYPDGEFMGNYSGTKISLNEICVVHNARCSNSTDFGTLITDRYGFPDGVTFGMTAESKMLAEASELKFKAAQAAKTKDAPKK